MEKTGLMLQLQQREKLAKLAADHRVSMSEIARRAIDAYEER